MDIENNWQTIVELIEEESAACIKLFDPDKEEIPEEIIKLWDDERVLTPSTLAQIEAVGCLANLLAD